MIRLIAARELRELWRDGRLPWAGGLVLLLLLVAMLSGWQHQRAADAERVAAQRLDYDDWLRQGERHPHDAAHQGMHVFKPASALTLLDPGITPYVGSTLWLRSHRQSDTKFVPAQDATGAQRFGTLSAAWVLQVLGPLLVIVLGFNLLSGEREQGTLRQLMSLGIKPMRLMLGKALALAVALLLLLTPAGIAVVALTPGDPDTLTRLLLLACAYAVYLGSFVFLALAVSAWSVTSRGALMLLLAIWIGGVVLAPRAVSDLAERAYPTPSRVEFNDHLNETLNDAYRTAWREQLGVDKRWGADLPLNRWGVALSIDDHAGYGVSDREFGTLWDNFSRQQRLQEWSGLLFPVLALRAHSMGVAGTDFAAHRDFAEAAERQRRLMQDLISHDLVAHADPLGNRHFDYNAGPDLWARVPPFIYRAPPLAAVATANMRSIAVLCAVFSATIALAWLAATATRRLQ